MEKAFSAGNIVYGCILTSSSFGIIGVFQCKFNITIHFSSPEPKAPGELIL